MLSKILIANRGEIACRVIDTCRRMGIRTVAVHSDADAAALHVELADEAVAIGGAAPGESYLRGDRIIAAARATGAEAIHPGYGFLSENPGFVEAVEAAGLVFIGPPAEAIRAMGLKDAAKRLMAEAGVPVVPGYHGPDQDPGHLELEAAEIGYPVLIKAVAGGGGKGMRRVDRPGDFVMALESAKAEARGAFGNEAVLIEKFIERPRHVEVQVFGDGTRAVHLFERDCSLQRRHQKVLEEAPAPGMPEETRAAICAAAVRAAEAIGYRGAGTVEFIADGSEGLRPDGFWFMEMNTRLQVEHPVTELVTGADLVEWQIRVAAGEPIPRAQAEIGLSGHAVEARLYAEDVPGGFLPATGRIAHLDWPPGARVDAGVRAGDLVTPYYDPMLAKIVVHGATRGEAFARLAGALAETRIAGCVTNLAFLARLAADEDVRSGAVDTGLIGRRIDALSALDAETPEVRALAALGALGLDREPAPFDGFHLWQPLSRAVSPGDGDSAFAARVTVTGPGRFVVTIGGETREVERAGGAWRIGGHRIDARIARHGGDVTVFLDGAHTFPVPDPLDRGGAGGAAQGAVLAPMPGRVSRVFVRPGDAVTAGDRLAILEAMKMEHTLTAPGDGTVAEVPMREGDQVEAGALVVRLAEDGA